VFKEKDKSRLNDIICKNKCVAPVVDLSRLIKLKDLVNLLQMKTEGWSAVRTALRLGYLHVRLSAYDLCAEENIASPYHPNDDDDSSEEHFNIYRYRRKATHSEIYPLPGFSGVRTSIAPNVQFELDKNKHQKTYAILQETRSEFSTNSKLRTLFFDVLIIVGLKFFRKWRKTLNLVEPETVKVVLNIILAVPYSFLYFLDDKNVQFNFHAIAPLVATVRVYRILEYFYNRSTQAGSNQWTTFLSQYLILFVLSVHTWACVWFIFANKSFDLHKIRTSWSLSAVYLPTEVTLDWYYVCTYWSVMFLTTNALGDLYPVTTAERIVAILATLLGFLLTTVVFVGSLTSQFITITTRRSKYVRQLKKIKNHLRIDQNGYGDYKTYYEDLWYQKSGVFKPKLLRLLPYPLQMEICYDLNAVPLYSSLIFRKLPEAFLRRLSLDMSHQFYLPGDVVYSHNQNKTIMVCITSGVLELLSDEDDESPMISFAKGTCFGEISLVYNIPARCTVKAATYVECQVLEKTKFIRLMMTYPDLVDSIRNEIEERINRSRLKKIKQGEHAEFSLNIYASKDRKKSSIKCLKDKLRYIQGRINKQMDFYQGVELTDNDNWLEKTVVPSELRKKVLHQARFKALTSIKFFQVKNKAYIHTLTEAARDIILPPGEIVFYGGTVTRELYIIESGYCLVTSNKLRENNTERVIGPGSHVGLLVLLYGVPTLSTVVTLTHCKLVSVSHYAYTSALSLFPAMKEHEDLLTPEELQNIEEQAKTQTTDSYLQHYNRLTMQKRKVKIASLLQEFFNNSFIDLNSEYKKSKKNYWKSFKQFHVLNNIAAYLLMPIAIRPDGIFLKVIVSMAPLFGKFNVTLIILETICYIDMYLMLHVAYYGCKNQLIYHPYMTAKHYLQGQFVIDFITCFPWYAIWKLFVPKHNEGHSYEDHEINAHMFHCALRMINSFILTAIWFVWKARSWIDGIIIIKGHHLSPPKILLLAYYWTATTFGGAGFGDITPQNIKHMILCICVNIHGVLFFGYVYARIASLKAMADQVVTKFQENLNHLELFLNREKVPFALKKTILEYWKYQWKRTGGWSHQSILGKFHANLNEDAVLYMYEKTLREIPLFENVEYSFFRAFAKKLKELYFQKGYMVMRSNEVIDTMFIIYRGKVDIISNINEVEACMGPGGIFGNIRGATKYMTMSNVIASRNIDLLCIQGRDFYALLKSYPSVLQKVKESVESAAKDYVLPTIIQESSSGPNVTNFSLSYETGEEEEDEFEIDPELFVESPEKSLAESHGSKSITSGNVDYIPAALLFFKPHRWFRSSVIPDSGLVTFMEYFILFVSYVDFMLLVYQMAFLSVPYFFYVCVIFDILFLLKVFLDIHSGYMNRYGDYVLNPKKVRKVRDFLANFLICYLVFALSLSPEMKMTFFCYTRSPQLTRISYLFTYRTHRKTSIGSANLLFKLTTIAIWASILSHVNACLFFKLSCLTPVHCTSANWMSKEALNLRAKYSEGNFFALYVAALWYIINLLTITGTGDVSAQNSFEVIETTIVCIIIKFCTGLLISEMSAMITAHSSSRIAYDYDINELRDGLRDMDLSVHQMSKMWDYVRELWNRQQGKQMPALVYKLPFRLRCQVMQAVYGSHIRESVIFSKTDDDFSRMLVMWMKHCVFFPGNYIVQCGDSDQCIYFIHRGQVEVLTVHPNLTESIYDVLGPEDSFGIAQGLFVGVVHHFSFRARTVVDIVYLKLDQWKYLLDYYPKSAKIVKQKVHNYNFAPCWSEDHTIPIFDNIVQQYLACSDGCNLQTHVLLSLLKHSCFDPYLSTSFCAKCSAFSEIIMMQNYMLTIILLHNFLSIGHGYSTLTCHCS
ncbi:hypothetical protein HW555_004634, partial [Spodoptera exigua]